MAAAEEQDSSPLAPSGNREEAASGHENNLPLVERVMGGDGPLHPESPEKDLPAPPGSEEQAKITDPVGVAMCDEPKRDDADLLFRIHGLYRLLDLISEQGSGGAGMIISS